MSDRAELTIMERKCTFVEKKAEALSAQELYDCYLLVRRIRPLYIAAGDGWNRGEKLSEMKDVPGLEYILVRDAAANLVAFCSYVIDDEDDHGSPTTFIYEIHVNRTHQGQGIGSSLLARLGQKSPHSLALRVFNINRRAINFYKSKGFIFDEAICTDDVCFMVKAQST